MTSIQQKGRTRMFMTRGEFVKNDEDGPGSHILVRIVREIPESYRRYGVRLFASDKARYSRFLAVSLFFYKVRQRAAILLVFLGIMGLLRPDGVDAEEIPQEPPSTDGLLSVADPCIQSSLGETAFCSVVLKPLYIHELPSPDLFARVAFALELSRTDGGMPTIADVSTVQQLVFGIFCAEELMRRGQGGLWVAADLAEMWALLASAAPRMPAWVKDGQNAQDPPSSARDQREKAALAELLDRLPKLTTIQFAAARDRVLAKVPNHPQTLRAAAIAEFAAHRYTEALEWLKQYETRESDNPYASLLHLSILAEIGGDDGAVKEVARKTTQLMPAWAWSVHRLQRIAELRRKDRGSADLEPRAVSVEDELQAIRDKVAVGLTTDASAALDRLEQAHPGNLQVAVAAVGLWVTFNNQQRWEKAVARVLALVPSGEDSAAVAWPARLLGGIRFYALAEPSPTVLETLPEFQLARKQDPVVADRVAFMVSAIQWLNHRDTTDKRQVVATCLDTVKKAPADTIVLRTAALVLWLFGEKEQAWTMLTDAVSASKTQEHNEMRVFTAILGTALSAQTGDLRYVETARSISAHLGRLPDAPSGQCPPGGCFDRGLATYVSFVADLVVAILKDDLDLQGELADKGELLSTTLGLSFEEAPHFMASLLSVGTFVAITQGRDQKATELANKARTLSPGAFPVVYNLALLALGAGDDLVANGFFEQASAAAMTDRQRHLVARLGLKFAEVRRSSAELRRNLETLLTSWDSAVPAGDGRSAVELVVSGDFALELALEDSPDGDRLITDPGLIQTISVVRTMRGLTRPYIQDLLDQMNEVPK